jgi:hypothetical protein
MKMKSLALMPLVGLLLLGCSEQQPQGRVMMEGDVATGSRAPQIVFRDLDGSRRTLSQVRQPVTIIGFVAPVQEPCDRVDQRLAGLMSQCCGLQISVVQVSEPTAKCPYGPGCVQTSGRGKDEVIAICDPDRSAWANYGRPAPGTIFLVDPSGRIVRTASLDNPDDVARQAQQMSTQFELFMEPRFEN